ncbi:hypothetical protein QA597_06955 [Marinilabiliaceae bacterium ANBcel2]|nr:hypothetical protein [Marinilabiliaceae bacterium ANBcel2]
MQFINKLTLYLTSGLFMLFAFSYCTCESKSDQSKTQQEIVDTAINDKQLVDDFEKSKFIFYSLPSPVETAMLIKRAGGGFDQDLLNEPGNASRYNSNLKMALNLGIYTANMSYASLFDQAQHTVNYMGTCRNLAGNLGILELIDEETIRRLEENMNNRDVVIDIISETFMNSNAYLTEQNRPAIAAMVLTGGWIEGLYIATSLTGGDIDNNSELVDRIVYQKLSLNTLLSLLETHKSDPDISYLIDRMESLQEYFNVMSIVSKSDIEAETNPEEKITIIRSQSEVEVTPEAFRELCNKVREIRSEFIS